MPLARKTDAREFVQEIRKAPQGVVFMNDDHVLILAIVNNGEQVLFEAPDPMDMETEEECIDFLVQVYQALSDRTVMQHVSYLG